MLVILLCKVLAFLGRLLGRGTSFPGAVALRMNKKILARLKLPATVIAVTGSNGKTSTTELIRAAAQATGKRVICNSEGSNQIEGITTLLLCNSSLRGETRADIAVLESDERFCQHTFSHFSPTHIVITNLYRDQTTRNGSPEFVAGELKKGLPEDSVLIANTDDPASSQLAWTRKDTLWYGIDATALREPKKTRHAYDDGAFCPICHSPMRYRWRVESQLGCYLCAHCGFFRSKPLHSVTSLQGNTAVIDKKQRIPLRMPTSMFAYNTLAAFTVAVEVLEIAPQTAAQILGTHAVSNKFVNRISSFQIGEHGGLFLLTKHENPMAYNGAIRSILSSGSKQITLVLLIDLLSRKYIANDMSWLWDIDFELLSDDRVCRIVLGGRFAHDAALRLACAGISSANLSVCPDIDTMMQTLRVKAQGDIYLLTCFTDIQKFTDRLQEGV